MRVGKSEKYEKPSRWYVYYPMDESESEATEYCPTHYSTSPGVDRKQPWIETQWRNSHDHMDVAAWYAELVWDNSACEAFNNGRDDGAEFVVIDTENKRVWKVYVSLEYELRFGTYNTPTEAEIDWNKFEERD